VAEQQAAVAALHQLGAHVLTGERGLQVGRAQRGVLGTPHELVVEAAVTLQLKIDGAGWTLTRVAALAASVLTPGRTTKLAGRLALLAVDAGRELVLGVPDPVTIPLARVVSAGQSPPTAPTAGSRLRLVTRQISNLVLTEAWDGDGRVAGRTGKFSNLEYIPLLPWSGGTTFVGNLYLDIVVTGDRAKVPTI